MNLHLFQYVLTAAVRDKLIISAAIILGLSVSLSIFLASSAITEQDQFASVISAGGIRIISALTLIVFTVFFVRKSIESKDIELLLSRPMNRTNFILSYAVAFSCIAILFGLANALAIYTFAQNFFGIGHAVWILTVTLEYIIIINVAFLFGMMLSSAAAAVMAVVGFYVLSRMIGQILGVIETGTSYGLWVGLEYTMQFIAIFTPRLDLMAQTSWLIYGIENMNEVIWSIAQSAVLLLIILTIAFIDLKKKQF